LIRAIPERSVFFESPLTHARFAGCRFLLTTFYGIDLRTTVLEAVSLNGWSFSTAISAGKITPGTALPAASLPTTS
jgi:uncharacterized protein YjbI with pentapeptide repeats